MKSGGFWRKLFGDMRKSSDLMGGRLSLRVGMHCSYRRVGGIVLRELERASMGV